MVARHHFQKHEVAVFQERIKIFPSVDLLCQKVVIINRLLHKAGHCT